MSHVTLHLMIFKLGCVALPVPLHLPTVFQKAQKPSLRYSSTVIRIHMYFSCLQSELRSGVRSLEYGKRKNCTAHLATCQLILAAPKILSRTQKLVQVRFSQLWDWIRKRDFSAWHIQTGLFTSLSATFVLKANNGKMKFTQLSNWMRQRGFSARAIQSGPFASL